MPYSDALGYFHGTGASAGLPITQTANALTGVSQALTTLSYTLAADARLVPGSVVVLAGGAPTVSAQVVVLAILTGSGIVGAGTATVNVSQTVTSTTATAYPVTLGDKITVDAYSSLELDFGPPSPGLAYPWVAAFPSLTEKGYTFPPEHPGSSGTEYGVHVLVESPFVATNDINFIVVTSAAVDPVIGTATNIIAQRDLTLAQLQVTGADYFIPVPQQAVLEFLRVYFDVTTTATGGTVVCYWGPRTGGES